MLNFFMHLLYWHWFILAAILLVLELVTGSGFLFWIGLSSAIMGVSVWLIPTMDWTVQLLSFAGLGIITALFWWLYLRRHPIFTDRPSLNRRGHQYIGRVFTLDAPIVNGLGHIRVDDTTWRVHCNHDLGPGEKIKIIGVDGVILLAKKE